MTLKIYGILCLFILLIGCTNNNDGNLKYSDYSQTLVPYDITSPNQIHKLHWDLEEISGLSALDDNKVAAIEDETGYIYQLEISTGDIIEKIKFGNGGDYEAIEVIGNQVYIFKSTGDLYQFTWSDSKLDETQKVNTIFTPSNDIEGLGNYKGKLIVAAKRKGDIKNVNIKGKGIFLLDGTAAIPLLGITKDRLNEHISNRKYFNYVRDFDPSGIAIKPDNGDIYIISADHILVVFDKDLKLKEVVSLNKKLLQQPEGIAFSPNGILLISSEGDGERGELHIFKPK